MFSFDNIFKVQVIYIIVLQMYDIVRRYGGWQFINLSFISL